MLDYYWPPGVRREETISAFYEAYGQLGFRQCANPVLEPITEKIAIFADQDGAPKHAPRQLPSGHWTSKLGQNVDIEHSLKALEGQTYGHVAIIMKRASTATY